MDDSEAIEFLMETIYFACDVNGEKVPDMRTFEEACLLTSNKGFVMRMPDGSEFQVQVLRSN
jgi:hypothetical protein